jgi:hypothetical protein
VGHFYDTADGAPTEVFRQMEAGLAKAADASAAEDKEKEANPMCNSRWTQEDGGYVWCDGGDRVPRKMWVESTQSTRCACVESGAAEGMAGEGKVTAYDGCDADAQRCKST